MDYQVESITVSSEYRCWNSHRGMTTSGQVSMTVRPPYPDILWSPQEASKVALQVRKRIQIFLIADADARQVELPDNGTDAISRYTATLKTIIPNPDQEVCDETVA